MELSVQKIFLISCISFISGVGMFFLFQPEGYLFFIFSLISVALFFALSWFDKRLFFVGIFIIIFTLGFLRANLYQEKKFFFQFNNFEITFLDNLRSKINFKINQYFFPPESEFVKGLILGQDSISDKAFKQDLNKTGTRHIVAVSGFNMVILAGFLYGILFFAGCSKKISFFILFSALIFYTLFVQAPASAVRAMIMALLTFGGSVLFTQARPLNSLFVAAVIMIFHKPSILFNDIGFQLSFLAVLGIVIFNNHFETIFKKLKFHNFISSILSISLSTQILIIPLLIYYFKGFSLLAPLINVFIVPLSSLLLVMSLIFASLSLIIPIIALFLTFPMNIITSLITGTITLFAKIPINYINVNLDHYLKFFIVYYLFTLILLYLFNFLKRKYLYEY